MNLLKKRKMTYTKINNFEFLHQLKYFNTDNIRYCGQKLVWLYSKDRDSIFF